MQNFDPKHPECDRMDAFLCAAVDTNLLLLRMIVRTGRPFITCIFFPSAEAKRFGVHGAQGDGGNDEIRL